MLARLGKDLKQLGKLLPNSPTTERDLHNLVYLYLCLKGYRVLYTGRPGRRNTIDFVVEGNIGLEVKYVRANLDIDKMIGQVTRYKTMNGLTAAIILIYIVNHRTRSMLRQKLLALKGFLEEERIVPIMIP